MKTEEYTEKRKELEGFPVRMISYRIGSTYHATVDNVEPGARIARAEGPSRADVEKSALDDATRRLARTQKQAI